MRYKPDNHKIMDIKALDGGKVKILINVENERLISYVYTDEGDENTAEMSLTFSQKSVSLNYSFSFLFMVSSFGKGPW